MAERSMGRGARALLYVSLLVNLLVIGLVVGTLFTVSERGKDRRPPQAGQTGLGPLLLALERDDRRELGIAMRRTLRAERLTRGEMRALMDEVQVLLATTPYDAEAVDAALADQFSEAEFRLNLARKLFLERLGDMTDAERAAYAARLKEVLENPPEDRRGPPRQRDN